MREMLDEMSQPEMPKFCSNCGKALEPGSKFCPSCGRSVIGDVSAAATELSGSSDHLTEGKMSFFGPEELVKRLDAALGNRGVSQAWLKNALKAATGKIHITQVKPERRDVYLSDLARAVEAVEALSERGDEAVAAALSERLGVKVSVPDWKKRERRVARYEGMRSRTSGDVHPEVVCPQCGAKGAVRMRQYKAKKGVSGGKATAAVLTGGVSLFATGLSRKEQITEAHCGNCSTTWSV